MLRRPHPLIAPALLAATMLSACSPEVACPAIGWNNDADLHLDGARADAVADLVVCVDDLCSDDPVDPTGERTPPGVFDAGVTWTASFGFDTLSLITVRALDASGGVLSEQDVALPWVRVGGSEECGGPHEAEATVTVS